MHSPPFPNGGRPFERNRVIGKSSMRGRTKLLVVFLVAAGILAPASLFALLFLNPLLALPICAAAAMIFLAMTLGMKRNRRDKLDELQARAAQRGDQSALIDKHFRW